MVGSGRRRAQHDSERQRRDGTAYGSALTEVCNIVVANKKSCTRKFWVYALKMLETLDVRALELCCGGRSAANWQQQRSRQKYLSQVADRLLNRTSLRLWKNTPPRHIDLNVAAPSPDEEEDLIQDLQDRKFARTQRKTIVFFGKARYSTPKKHNSMPTKGLVKVLCS